MMTVNYKEIADAIPKSVSDVAYAELAVQVPSIKTRFIEGNASSAPETGKDGKQVYHDCKFMTDTNIIAAFDAIKGETTTVGEGEEAADVLVFPGLKPGHVQNAMQKRYRGEI
jgi:hypothetical protein